MASRKTARKARTSGPFTDEEKAAMREHAREMKAARGPKAQDGEAEVLAKIGSMKGSDRTIAARLHKIVRETAPSLLPRTWYGMPAYAREGRVLCFFQDAAKFKSRYATFGFNDAAALDDGAMWATSFALTALNAAEEAKIRALLKKAVG